MRVISQHGNVDLPYEQIFECLIGDMKSSRTKYYYKLKYTIEHQRIKNETIEKYKTTQFHIAC